MKGRGVDVTELQLVRFREMGLSDIAIRKRIERHNGNIDEALSYPKNKKPDHKERLGKSRSTRLPEEIDKKLCDFAENHNISISEAIAICISNHLIK